MGTRLYCYTPRPSTMISFSLVPRPMHKSLGTRLDFILSWVYNLWFCEWNSMQSHPPSHPQHSWSMMKTDIVQNASHTVGSWPWSMDGWATRLLCMKSDARWYQYKSMIHFRVVMYRIAALTMIARNCILYQGLQLFRGLALYYSFHAWFCSFTGISKEAPSHSHLTYMAYWLFTRGSEEWPVLLVKHHDTPVASYVPHEWMFCPSSGLTLRLLFCGFALSLVLARRLARLMAKSLNGSAYKTGVS